jgi:hypothetical protein
MLHTVLRELSFLYFIVFVQMNVKQFYHFPHKNGCLVFKSGTAITHAKQ